MPTSVLYSVADYVADARVLLQDTISPYRYDDDSLVTALNVTLAEARRIRPDLFVFENGVEFFTQVDNKPVKIEVPFRLGILHGLVGHALTRDQEDYQDIRATTFMGIFNDILLGLMIRPMAGGSAPGGR